MSQVEASVGKAIPVESLKLPEAVKAELMKIAAPAGLENALDTYEELTAAQKFLEERRHALKEVSSFIMRESQMYYHFKTVIDDPNKKAPTRYYLLKNGDVVFCDLQSKDKYPECVADNTLNLDVRHNLSAQQMLSDGKIVYILTKDNYVLYVDYGNYCPVVKDPSGPCDRTAAYYVMDYKGDAHSLKAERLILKNGKVYAQGEDRKPVELMAHLIPD